MDGGCNRMEYRLQPHGMEAATVRARGCNRMQMKGCNDTCRRLQPHVTEAVIEAVTVCNRGSRQLAHPRPVVKPVEDTEDDDDRVRVLAYGRICLAVVGWRVGWRGYLR